MAEQKSRNRHHMLKKLQKDRPDGPTWLVAPQLKAVEEEEIEDLAEPDPNNKDEMDIDIDEDLVAAALSDSD